MASRQFRQHAAAAPPLPSVVESLQSVLPDDEFSPLADILRTGVCVPQSIFLVKGIEEIPTSPSPGQRAIRLILSDLVLDIQAFVRSEAHWRFDDGEIAEGSDVRLENFSLHEKIVTVQTSGTKRGDHDMKEIGSLRAVRKELEKASGNQREEVPYARGKLTGKEKMARRRRDERDGAEVERIESLPSTETRRCVYLIVDDLVVVGQNDELRAQARVHAARERGRRVGQDKSRRWKDKEDEMEDMEVMETHVQQGPDAMSDERQGGADERGLDERPDDSEVDSEGWNEGGRSKYEMREDLDDLEEFGAIPTDNADNDSDSDMNEEEGTDQRIRRGMQPAQLRDSLDDSDEDDADVFEVMAAAHTADQQEVSTRNAALTQASKTAKGDHAAPVALLKDWTTTSTPLKLTPLRSIPILPYKQNYAVNVLAVVVALSDLQSSHLPPHKQRSARLADPSTSKHVLLNVFLDPEAFTPKVGSVVLLAGVKNHRFDGGCLKKYANDGQNEKGKQWWFEDPWEFEWCDVSGLKAWWRTRQTPASSEKKGV